ncbi:MAG: HlyD family efflux transporter periplasmic adaptor subunit [Clostridia bacterium]|nr:HlyD family efflux transporter periplasmic adaptor subunit [Clostridia bacterium]
MKKILAILMFLTLLPVAALAETTFDGTVVAGDAVTVTAPFGGTVTGFSLRAGSKIAMGDVVAAIGTTKVYASADGTIAGVFAQEGDTIDSVTSRWGAVMYIMPTHKYTITADIEKAYNSSETKYVNIGETVYIACTAGNDHKAVGVVTAASGNTYTVETTSGTLMLDETVSIYRSSGYAANSRIGRGTVGRTQEIAVNGSGSILKLHVKDGDKVSRGDLLFETVTGTLDGLYAVGSEVVSTVSGVVASVNTSSGSNVSKGDILLTVYTMDTLQIEISVNEYDLMAISEGDTVNITFNYNPDAPAQLTGVVSMISHLSSSQDGEATYLAYVDFVPDDNVRIGMTAVVTTIDEQPSAGEHAMTEDAPDAATPAA